MYGESGVSMMLCFCISANLELITLLSLDRRHDPKITSSVPIDVEAEIRTVLGREVIFSLPSQNHSIKEI
jgi:hypothetical protein